MLPDWTNFYIGIPFKELGRDKDGCDCYGLARLVYKEQFDIDLPDYTEQYTSTRDGEILDSLIEEESKKWKLTELPEIGDLILYKILGLRWHIGILIEKGLMLHTEKNVDSHIEHIDSIRWKKAIDGYYRYCK